MSQDVKCDVKKSVDCTVLNTGVTFNVLAPCWAGESDANFNDYFGPVVMDPKERVKLAAQWINDLKCQVGGLQEVDASTYPMLVNALSPRYALGPMASSPTTSAKDANNKMVLNGTVLLYDAKAFAGVSVVHSTRNIAGNGVAYMRVPVKLLNGKVVDVDFISWHPDAVTPVAYKGGAVVDGVIEKRHGAWMAQYAEVIKGCSPYVLLFTDANMEKYSMMTIARQTVFKKFLLSDQEKFRRSTHASLRVGRMAISYGMPSDDLFDLLSHAVDGGPVLPGSESSSTVSITLDTLMKFGSDHAPCTLTMQWKTPPQSGASPMNKS